MKRFWTEVALAEEPCGHGLRLDGKPVRTPGRVPLVLPSPALAEAVAQEWRGVGETVNPRAMPMTGLSNAAIDRVLPDPDSFAAGLARYGESDLTCYRADDPEPLVLRQSQHWDPLLAWARACYGAELATVTGVMHRTQPPEAIERLRAAVAEIDPFRLAGLSPLVTVSGSLLIGLALLSGRIGREEAWAAAQVDEDWQAEQWGEDQLALQAREARRADFDAGARFVSLL